MPRAALPAARSHERRRALAPARAVQPPRPVRRRRCWRISRTATASCSSTGRTRPRSCSPRISRCTAGRWPPGRAATAPGTGGCRSGGTSTATSARTSSTGCAPTARCRRASIEDLAVAPWLSSGWNQQRNASRMLELMWVRGHRRRRCARARPAAVGPDGALPAAGRADRPPRRRRGDAAGGAAGAAIARRGARAAHPRALHARPLPRAARRCSPTSQAEGEIVPVEVDGLKGGVVDARRGRRDDRGARRRRLAPAHRAALAVRQPDLRSRPRRGAVRLHPPAGDLHAEGEAASGATSCCRSCTATG